MIFHRTAKTRSTSDGVKLISWNVNGIRSVHRKGALTAVLEKLKPDIVCLQETKAEQHQSEIDLPDYEEYWNPSSAKRGYSGTAIFSKQKPRALVFDLPEDIVKEHTLANDGYGDPNREGRVIAAEFKDFYVATVYTPNAKDDLSRLNLRHKHWDPAFLAYMKRLEKKKPVIFCGDLNVAHTADDLARPDENEGRKGFTKEEREGIDKLIDAGFVDAFRLFHKGKGHYTWWSHFSNARMRNIGWRIDYIFVSKSLVPKVRSVRIYPEFHGSDHCPVSLEVRNAG